MSIGGLKIMFRKLRQMPVLPESYTGVNVNYKLCQINNTTLANKYEAVNFDLTGSAV